MAKNNNKDRDDTLQRLRDLENEVFKKNKNRGSRISTFTGVAAILISFAFGLYNIRYTLETKKQEDLEKTLSNLDKSLKELDQLDNSDFQNSQFRQDARRELVLSILRSKLKRNGEYIEFVGPNTLMMLGDQMLIEPNMEEALNFYRQALSKASSPELRSYAYNSLGHFYGVDSEFKDQSKKYAYWNLQIASLDSVEAEDKGLYIASAYHTICQSEYAFGELDSANKFLGLAKQYYLDASSDAGRSAAMDLENLHLRKNIEMNNLKLPINRNSLYAYLRNKFQLVFGSSFRPVFDQEIESEDLIVSTFLQNLQFFEIDSIHKLEELIPSDFVKLVETRAISEPLNFTGIMDASLFLRFGDEYLTKSGFESKDDLGIANELVDKTSLPQ